MNDELLYQGHGQIEIYPINTSILGIISHELRHANFNRYIALQKDKELSQNIKITLQYKNGYLYPDNAYTEAEFKENTKKEEILLKILFLKLKIKSILKKDPNSILINQYKKEIDELQRKFFNINTVTNIYKFKKDNAKLIGFFRDIYFYQKYNLPSISLDAPFFKDAYSVKQKLDEIYKNNIDNKEFQIKNIIEISDLFQNRKIDAFLDVYNCSLNLKNYLSNFSINLKVAENDYIDYFSVTPLDSAKNGVYKIKILNIAKSFIIYSDKISNIYESLNFNGSFKINGVEIDIFPEDSLYDIVNKINWGEDLNHNYQLDEGEDLNGNNKLDGGTKEHGVYAFIESNRLYLKNVETGDITIDIEDDNNIFHELGIIAENPYNNLTYFPNIAQKGEDAKIEINEKIFTSHSNTFFLSDFLISVNKKIENAKFEVKDNTEGIYNQIEELVDKYNFLINKINNYLSENQELENNLGLLLIKRGLKIAFFSNYSDVNNIGINIKNDKNFVKELEIYSSIVNEVKKFNNSIIDKLYSIGIKSNDDETVEINKEKLKRAIKNNPINVKNIFLGEKGIKNNLQNFLNKILDKESGIIEHEINKLTMQDFKKLIKNFLKEKGNFDYILEKLHSIESIVKNG